MSTVAEIKTAFKQLPEREQWKLAEWIQETLQSFETLDADGARGREPLSAVVSIVRKVKRERRGARRSAIAGVARFRFGANLMADGGMGGNGRARGERRKTLAK